MNQPEFASVPLPIRIRLFQQNKEAFSFSDLRVFFDNYYQIHPTNFQVLFNNINLKFQTPEEIDELCLSFFLGFLAKNFQKKKAALLGEINNYKSKIKG